MTDPTPSVDLTAIPEMRELVEFVARRLAETPEEAAQSQPGFERGLREVMLKLERAVHSLDFARLDDDVPGRGEEGHRTEGAQGSELRHDRAL